MATMDASKDIDEKHLELTESASPHAHDNERAAANAAAIERFTPEEQRKIIRRIDMRLVSVLGLLYCVSLMDRTNTGIVMVAGMAIDLQVTGPRYSLVVLLFFIPYVLFQPPSTVILRKLGPATFLPATVILWGMVTIGMGFVRHWYDLIPLRILLGICEAGFFPSCAYLLSCWYPRYELQKRNAVFYAIGTMASAFSGILAYGFSQMQGLGKGPVWWGRVVIPPAVPRPTILPGLSGWRWIFVMQGVLTCVLGLLAYIFIVGFPDVTQDKKTCAIPFLNKEEAAFIVARIDNDRQDATPEKFSIRKYMKHAADLKIWGFAALFGLTTTNTYAIAFFLPIILNEGMGFNAAAAQCLIAPPYVAAAIVMFTMAWLSDKYHIRSPFILLNCVILFAGLALLGFAENVGARYFGVFLATSACNANVPCILTWQANNIRGQWKRALCSATLVGMGGVGGIVGSTVFRTEDKPTYRPGIYATMISSALMIIITCLLNLKFWRANKRVDAGGKRIEGLEGFKYTY